MLINPFVEGFVPEPVSEIALLTAGPHKMTHTLSVHLHVKGCRTARCQPRYEASCTGTTQICVHTCDLRRSARSEGPAETQVVAQDINVWSNDSKILKDKHTRHDRTLSAALQNSVCLQTAGSAERPVMDPDQTTFDRF